MLLATRKSESGGFGCVVCELTMSVNTSEEVRFNIEFVAGVAQKAGQQLDDSCSDKHEI